MQAAAPVFLWTVVALSVLAVVSRTLRGWFAKPGLPPTPVVIVAGRGPSLWNRLSGQVAAGAFLAAAIWALMHSGTGKAADTPGSPAGVPHVSAVPLPDATFSGFAQDPSPARGR